MEKNKTNVLLTSMLTASLVFGGWMAVKNKTSKMEAAKERSVLLSEKDMLTKEAKSLAAEKDKFLNLSSDRKKRIDELTMNLDAKGLEINRLMNENANLNKLKIKIKEYEQVKNELINEVAYLKRTINGANLSKSEMEAEMNHLRLQNEKLSSELTFLKTLNLNDFMVKGVKRNNKVTSFANRSKEISLTFDIPEGYTNDLTASVLTPDGKTIFSSTNEILTIRSTEEATETVFPGGMKAKRMELILKPEKKFSKGVYKFTVYKSKETIETILLQLR